MKHFGDITKLSGFTLPMVDVITGGSPCQDLSVAGKGKGLDGERSGLFFEQIRIVKEMRNKDVQANGRAGCFIRPRYMVWENVDGARSSPGIKFGIDLRGKDFQTVLTEIARIAEPDCPDVPMPEKGKWPKSGCIYGEMGNWSVAWRVHDAQFWGVPQRRKRIALVADFGGLSAPDIIFERRGLSAVHEPLYTQRKGLSWDSTQSGAQREETARAVGNGTKSASGVVSKGNGEAFVMREKSSSLTVGGGMAGQGYPCVLEQSEAGENGVERAISFQERAGKPGGGKGILIQPERTGALSTLNNQAVFDARGNGDGAISPTLTDDHQNRVTDYTALAINGDVAGTLDANYYKGCGERQGVEREVVAYDIVQSPLVRRLTPIECERLQGFPDNWTNIGEWIDSKGKKHKQADAPRYKALGNSIALPFWQWLARRICAQYERDIEIGSLFDGIGGFPYVFERCGAKAAWASEIEEFPIAVTKKRFPEGAE